MFAHEQLGEDGTSYRDLGEADCEEIAQLLLFRAASESTSLTCDQVRSLIHDALLGNLFGIVAEQSGRLCGIAIYGLNKSETGLFGNVVSIAIEHDFVGRGIRAGLSNAIERQLETVGISLKS